MTLERIKQIILKENEEKKHIRKSWYKEYPNYQYWCVKCNIDSGINELICADDTNYYCRFQLDFDVLTDVYLLYDKENNTFEYGVVGDYYIQNDFEKILEKICKYEDLILKGNLNNEQIGNLIFKLDCVIGICHEVEYSIGRKYERNKVYCSGKDKGKGESLDSEEQVDG